MKELIIATKNKGKAKEFEELFNQYGVTVKCLLDLERDVPDVEETGTTFHENARLKAETIANLLDTVVLADDSGLAVDALDGRPGVYSARYAGEPKDDRRNNDKLLAEMAGKGKRDARFVCVLACAVPGGETIYADGFCEGYIAERLAGQGGFGYDPLFIPKGYDVSMAELGSDTKNHISHRFHALNNLEMELKHKGLL